MTVLLFSAWDKSRDPEAKWTRAHVDHLNNSCSILLNSHSGQQYNILRNSETFETFQGLFEA